MHRNKLLNLLYNYTPTEVDEIKFKNDVITFVEQNEDCFESSLPAGHITGSAWLLNKSGDAALLTHHAKLDKWFQLGGHCDGDPDVLNVAIREAKEESGIENIEPVSEQIFDIDIHFFPKTLKNEGHYHYDIRFLLQVKSTEDFKISSESKELKWFVKDKLKLPNSDRSITRMFDKWIKLRVTNATKE